MSQTMKYCAACEDQFEPTVSKIAKYCSSDCAYDHTGKNVEQCNWCGDDFDIKFTKTFAGCCETCDNLLGMKLLNRMSRRFTDDQNHQALFLVTDKILELCNPPQEAK